jgi:phosphoribosylformylglycinamidine synthase subunit PurQ / glutaminase
MVKALVLTGYGINCDMETAHAFGLAGADAVRVHINDLIRDRKILEDFQILAFPGGFSFGDDIASGKVLANKLKHNLLDALDGFIAAGKLMIGICNGYQAMIKLGLLPGFGGKYMRDQPATLSFNDSGRFEDRWVWLKPDRKSKCVFTKGIDRLYLPVRHGEGKFIPDSRETLERLERQGQVVVRYSDRDGNPTQEYPLNPNGSVDAMAGICDETGRIFGLMPHPEAFLHKTNHPRWTRENLPDEGQGVAVFRNAVEYATRQF